MLDVSRKDTMSGDEIKMAENQSKGELSVVERLDAIESRLDAIEAQPRAKGRQGIRTQQAASTMLVDIDDPKWGDPPIFSDPSKWTGEKMKGRKMSECSVEYLRNYAEFLGWLGDYEDKNRVVDRNGKLRGWMRRRDAAKALAWVKRKEEQAQVLPDVEDEIPF